MSEKKKKLETIISSWHKIMHTTTQNSLGCFATYISEYTQIDRRYKRLTWLPRGGRKSAGWCSSRFLQADGEQGTTGCSSSSRSRSCLCRRSLLLDRCRRAADGEQGLWHTTCAHTSRSMRCVRPIDFCLSRANWMLPYVLSGLSGHHQQLGVTTWLVYSTTTKETDHVWLPCCK